MKSLIRRCPVCDHSRGDVIHHQTYAKPDGTAAPTHTDIVACERCGACFADVRESQHELDEQYRAHSKYADTTIYAEDPALAGRPPTDAPWDLQRLAGTASWISGRVAKTAKVLDAGCASGALIGFLQEEGFENIVGLDPSPGATAAVEANYGVRAITGSFVYPPSDIGQFDLVILSHVLEHLGDINAAVLGMRKLSSHDGHVYVEVPDATRYKDFLVAPFNDFNTEHINHFSPATLQHAMSVGGLVTDHVSRKLVLCSPSDEYPALFALFGPSERAAPIWPKDHQLADSLREYTSKSLSLLATMTSRVSDSVGRRPVVIWGAGQLSLKLLAGPLSHLNVTSIVDTSSAKWGSRVGPIEVIPPTELPDDGAPIVVTSVHHQASIEAAIRSLLPGRQIITLR